MPFTVEQSQKVAAAILAKAKHPCALCGQWNWKYGDRLIILEGGPEPTPSLYVLAYRQRNQPDLGKTLGPLPPVYPVLPLWCENCGNTLLLNVYQLGVAEIWQGQIPPKPSA